MKVTTKAGRVLVFPGIMFELCVCETCLEATDHGQWFLKKSTGSYQCVVPDVGCAWLFLMQGVK